MLESVRAALVANESTLVRGYLIILVYSTYCEAEMQRAQFEVTAARQSEKMQELTEQLVTQETARTVSVP